MFKLCVAHTNDPDTAAACVELLAQCDAGLSDWQPRAGILLAAIDYDHQHLVDTIMDRWPELQLIGCTTDGELSSVLEFQQDSVSLTLLGGDGVEYGAGIGTNASADNEGAAEAAVQMARTAITTTPKLCITFPEALNTNGVAILQGLQQSLGETVPVFGGLAADQWRFVKTWQFCGRKIYNDAVPVLLISGDISLGHGVASGWRPVGNPGIVTHSEGPIVYKIDDMTALDYYQSYIGAREPSSQFPLAVDVGAGNYYLRAPSGDFDATTGSVTFFAEVPEGSRVQMTDATRDAILDGAVESMRIAMDSYAGEHPDAALFVSCASRRQLLGTKTGQEIIGAIAKSNGAELPFAGFYANGEIGPMQSGDITHFHNETFVTLLIGTASQ